MMSILHAASGEMQLSRVTLIRQLVAAEKTEGGPYDLNPTSCDSRVQHRKRFYPSHLVISEKEENSNEYE